MTKARKVTYAMGEHRFEVKTARDAEYAIIVEREDGTMYLRQLCKAWTHAETAKRGYEKYRDGNTKFWIAMRKD